MNYQHPALDYSHKQKAPLCLLLYAFAIYCFVLTWSIDQRVGVLICAGVGLLMLVAGASFHYLKIEDRGDELAIAFGPLPVFSRKLEYFEIQSVEIGRTLILDGWGIHYSVRGGWVWNLWGRDCIVILLRNGGKLRIGTDDQENLAAFLNQKIESIGMRRD